MTIDLMSLTPRPPDDEAVGAGRRRAESDAGAGNLLEDFGAILKSRFDDLSSLQSESERLDRGLADGSVENIQEVMVAAARANLALDVAIQVRNLATRAFQRLSTLR